MAAQSKQKIELLPQEEWEQSGLGRFLKWTLNVGRYIVIATEVVVVVAFISRFKLDRDLTNLHEEIKKKQTIIEANHEFQQNFLFLQTRLNTISQIENEQAITATAVENLVPLIPQDVSLSNLICSGPTVSMTATALSESGLATFINNLRNSPKFSQVQLSGISTGTQGGLGIQFTLKTEVAKTEGTI